MGVGAPFMAPAAPKTPAPALGEIVRTLKGVTARRIRQESLPSFAWQRNYYEHVIRDENSLRRIREYIRDNPAAWPTDAENPARTAAIHRAPKQAEHP